jgi:valyl-tRNA synthetase
VKNDDIRVVPETWKKTWFNWLENIQPWCVSRQLWWGHRIPAWFGPVVDAEPFSVSEDGDFAFRSQTRTENYENEVFVAEDEASAVVQAASFYAVDQSEIAVVDTPQDAIMATIAGVAKRVIWRDPDVLDTWFSSALWPFATLGWPEESSSPPVGEGRVGGAASTAKTAKTPQETHSAADAAEPPPQPSPQGGGRKSDLARHYPNDVLISGFDILFFWDARMAMQGIELMGEAPWKTLYLHGLVRDAQGAKMSKSKGNTVDPLGLIDKYGADALRFTLAAMESQGRDIKLDEKRVEGYRNFATKLWNAARFLQMNGVGASGSIAALEAELPVNRWIIGEVVETLAKLNRAFEELRYDEMADAIYHFVWHTFCDWYVELVKPTLGEDATVESRGAEETRRVAAWAFDQILVMLHPLMPFITEEIWHGMGERPYELIVAKWPEPQAQIDQRAKAETEWRISLVSQIRSAKNELGIAPGQRMRAFVRDANADTKDWMARFWSGAPRLARIDFVLDSPAPPGPSLQLVVNEATFVVPLEGVIDVETEKSRLSKGAQAAEKERDSLAQRLANPNFTERAKPEAVEKARADHEAKAAEAERLRAALERLG